MFKATGRIIKWIGGYKRRLYAGCVCSFLTSISTALPIVAAAFALNELLQDFRGIKPVRDNFALLMFGAVALSVFLRFLMQYLRARLQESIGHEVGAEERIGIGDLLKRVPLGYFSKNHTGDISAVITTELAFLELLGMNMIDKVVNGYINVGVMIIALSFFSLPIALVSLAGVVVSAVFLQILKNGSDRTSPIVHRAQEDMAGSVIEYVRGMAVVKAFGRSGSAMKGISSAFADSRKININVEKKYAPVSIGHLFALKAASVAIVLISAVLAMRGGMPLAYMFMMLIFSFSIFSPVEPLKDSSHVLGILGSTLDNFRKLKDTVLIDAAGRDISPEKFDISFSNVSFAYDGPDVIRNVSFNIPHKTTTAIVGPSGCGKTTLCNLLARFYDVKDGSITIGDHDVREFSCDSLLKNFSMVFQNVYLFHDTVRNNIAFGKTDASMNEIIEAAEQARCHDFIMQLPEGYDTLIGEGGSSLSGGEKQRVSIARAILKDAPIVILDEATASIDPENEHLIQGALSELTAGKTIIIIAHRLATIEGADQIVVLEEGRLVQCGTHTELLETEGLYSRFLQIRQEAEGWSLRT